MELPKIKRSGAAGMLDGIKSKLGFADAGQGYDDGYYDRGYDDRSFQDEFGDERDAEEFGEYGPGYREDDVAADEGAGSGYDRYAPVTTRPVRTGRSAARSAGGTPPKLVSIDDVRARTQVPESLTRDPLPPRRVSAPSSASYRAERTMVAADAPAPANTPNARAAAAQGRERSESLNALFTSTTSDPASAASPAVSGTAASPAALSGAAAPASSLRTAPARSITLLRPSAYGDMERVAPALKNGDAVVLALHATPEGLAKRVLDFSFGVSSALDATVDCVADKVFAITCGTALSEAEKAALRGQGVL